MVKAAKSAVLEMNALESSIVETRRRIDHRAAELERRLWRALNARYLLTHYKSPLAIAAFGLGFIAGLGAFKGKKRGKSRNLGSQALLSAVAMRIISPVVTELLLQKIKKSDR